MGGVVKLSWPEPVHVVCNVAPHKPIKRCSMSNACVLEPGRTSTAELIGEALLKFTVKPALYPSKPGVTLVITGRFVIRLSFASYR